MIPLIGIASLVTPARIKEKILLVFSHEKNKNGFLLFLSYIQDQSVPFKISVHYRVADIGNFKARLFLLHTLNRKCDARRYHE